MLFRSWALTQQGRTGYDALITLRGQRGTDGKPGKLALRAENAFNQAGYNRDRDEDNSEELVANLTERIESYPAGKAIPAGFVKFLKQDTASWKSWERNGSCFARHRDQQKCVLLQVDLNQDGSDEVVLGDRAFNAPSRVYAVNQKTWRWVGHLMPEDGSPDSVRAELATGDYAVQPQRWDALRLGKSRFQVFEKVE